MKRSVRDLSPAEISGRRAFVRVDFNVPLEGGRIVDASRVEASHPTLRFLLEKDARPVLASHLGRPKGMPDPSLSLAPVADELERGLGLPVHFVGPADSPEALEASRALGGEAVLLLENTRFLPGEETNDPELARRLATLGDFFVNEAFGSLHRAHASTVGVAEHLRPAVAGLLVGEELRALGALRGEVERPFVVALGGAKIGDKLELIEGFAERADVLLVGGAMANTFLASQGYELGRSLVERDVIEEARRLRERANDKLQLPSDLIVTASPDADRPEGRCVEVGDVLPEEAAVDIGERTRREFVAVARSARTFFWNGPMGLFEREPFAAGTFALALAVAEATDGGAFTVVGGGESASAVRRAGVADRISHLSTGGGAALEFLAKGTLPGFEVLDEAPVPHLEPESARSPSTGL